MKNIYSTYLLIVTISLNLIIGLYFILFKKELLEPLFNSMTPFIIVCLINALLFFRLFVVAIKQNNYNIFSTNTEERGFAFMDLNHSTSIAEKLGHQQYSNFLKDSFELLEQLIEKVNGLEVYQYVGDEAVLSWKLSNEKINSAILEIQPKFQESIYKNKEYFKHKYDIIPNFKCAIHGGNVTKTFIGKDQRRVAFHGDVLNTTSRMLGMCHSFKTPLLVSEFIYSKAHKQFKSNYFEKLGAVDIQGKVFKIPLMKMNCSALYNSLITNNIQFSLH